MNFKKLLIGFATISLFSITSASYADGYTYRINMSGVKQSVCQSAKIEGPLYERPYITYFRSTGSSLNETSYWKGQNIGRFYNYPAGGIKKTENGVSVIYKRHEQITPGYWSLIREEVVENTHPYCN